MNTFDFGKALDRTMGVRPVSQVVGAGAIADIVAAQNLAKVFATQPHVVGGFFSSIAHAVSSVAKGAVNVVKAAAPFVQGLVSLIPGVGTGISAAIGAGMAILEGGGPLEIAVKTAYGAIPIPPGIRSVTDRVVDAALSLVHTKSLTDASIAVIRNSFPDGLPRQVFDTLAHIVLGAIHKQPTHAMPPKKGAKPKPVPPPHAPHIQHPVPHLAAAIALKAHPTTPPQPAYYVKNASVVFHTRGRWA